jgi:electron transfer flavoprotein beta subunit
MMARKKPLTILEPSENKTFTASVHFEKPAPKGAIIMVDADNIDELIDLLHNEAKVI